MRDLEQKVAAFIAAEGLFSRGEKVLLALSGGADSTALLHIISVLKGIGLPGGEIFCAHVNHQLRGDEAKRDEDFVISRCDKLGLPVITTSIGVRGYARSEKLSIETAARKLRMDCLLDIAERQNCTCIATAHQKNDNAETIIHRLSRGTGFRGLCGIWSIKEFTKGVRFVRPLLAVSRSEILEYLNQRKINWCQDRTNLDCYYRRNFIRNCVLPALQKDCKSDIVEQISELAGAARRFYRSVCSRADTVWPDIAALEKGRVSLDLDVLATQTPEVKVEIVRRVLAYLCCGEQDFTEQHYENILRLLDGSKLQLPNRIEAHQQRTKIAFTCCLEKPIETSAAEAVQLKIPGMTEFSGLRIEAEKFDFNAAKFKSFKSEKDNFIEWFDFDKVRMPLTARFRRRGDRFLPLGMAGEKRVGKFLTNAKIPDALRRKILVVSDSEKIIWLCPVRISEQAKITAQTRTVLQLKTTETHNL